MKTEKHPKPENKNVCKTPVAILSHLQNTSSSAAKQRSKKPQQAEAGASLEFEASLNYKVG